ncbi:MAG: hypothetical protein V2G43_06685 [bacterium JZ-2024 1]
MGLILLFVGLLIFFVICARPNQLQSVLSFMETQKDRVAIQVKEKMVLTPHHRPSETIKQFAEFIHQRSGASAEEVEKFCDEPASWFRGGLLWAKVLASEVWSVPVGQEYFLFSPVKVPDSEILLIDYEPDVLGYIFREPFQVTVLPRRDARVAEYFNRKIPYFIVAKAEVRKKGMGDYFFLKKIAQEGKP